MTERGTSGYRLYSNAVRPRIKDENPGMKPQDVMRLIGAEWSALDAGEKATYNQQAAALAPQQQRKKKPPTAYTIFNRHVFKTFPGTFAEKTAAVAAKWRGMTQEEREPYIKEAAEEATTTI